MSAREDLADHLRAWRKQAGLTQEQAAEALGVDPSQLSRWENGKQLPKQNRSRDFAHVYQVDRALVSEKLGAAHEEDAGEGRQALKLMATLSDRVATMQKALDEILRRLPKG